MRGIYDVQDYGAKGDGAANDLAALQATVDAADSAGGGTVWLGPGTYNIGAGTWKIGQAGTQHHINIEGINPNTTRIICDTSSGNAAIYCNLEKYVYLKRFSVANQAARGGYGIQFGGDLGPGMQTNGNIVEQILFQNFNFGAYLSGGIGTASDIEFDHCIWQNNKYGFYSGNFNSLDYLLLMPEFYDNDTGAFIATGNMTVLHGASNGNGTDFLIPGGNDGTVKIVGFRSELTKGPWLVAMSNSYLSIEDCLIHPIAQGSEVMRIGAGVRVTNTRLNGYISCIASPDSAIILDGVVVSTPGTDWTLTTGSIANPPFAPGIRLEGVVGPVVNARIYVRNVFDYAIGGMYPDFSGVFSVRSDNQRVVQVKTVLA